MAIIGSAQVTFADLTDAYGVTLTNDSYVFLGTTSAAKAGSTTTQVIAMLGDKIVDASVVLSEITKPAGITVTMDSNKTSPTLTITASTSFTTAGVVEIPVHIEDLVINKQFSVSIAFTGSKGSKGDTGSKGSKGDKGDPGAKGDKGEAAYSIFIETLPKGTIFKNDEEAAKTATVHVYKDGAELTETQINALGGVKWYKGTSTTSIGTGISIVVSAADVEDVESYKAVVGA